MMWLLTLDRRVNSSESVVKRLRVLFGCGCRHIAKHIWRMSDLIYRPEEEVLAELENFKSHILHICLAMCLHPQPKSTRNLFTTLSLEFTLRSRVRSHIIYITSTFLAPRNSCTITKKYL
eukprot:TRINITY_DN36251_c0_g1_i2.p1 TRINITY_DN36251_c0_g1~~TRINITY_DN36251_c0_g1_i2.p1  ORF type:complete len:120 (+),score=3.11 TRINITY_DN36251_c0_g1_i2:252-611(+)